MPFGRAAPLTNFSGVAGPVITDSLVSVSGVIVRRPTRTLRRSCRACAVCCVSGPRQSSSLALSVALRASWFVAGCRSTAARVTSCARRSFRRRSRSWMALRTDGNSAPAAIAAIRRCSSLSMAVSSRWSDSRSGPASLAAHANRSSARATTRSRMLSSASEPSCLPPAGPRSRTRSQGHEFDGAP